MKKVTIEDVASRAGVSKATVSAVLNHKNVVRPDTHAAVLKAMKDLHYRPRPSARSLKTSGTERGNIDCLIRELDNPFYTTIILGVMRCAAEHGYLVLVTSSEGSHAQEELITGGFSHKEVKGAIIAPVLEGTAEIEHLFRLKMINFPFVLLEHVKGIHANVVAVDNVKAMRAAVRYLISGGHSQIVHFAGPRHASHAIERIEGFTRAFTESPIAFSPDMIVPAGAHLEDGYRTAAEFFRSSNGRGRPTAVVCYNDLVALGVMSALHDLGIDVPGVVSVIGNDDIPIAQHIPVKLTTIRAPMFDMGVKAAQILIRNIDATRALPVENVAMEAELVVRQSTRTL